MDDTYSSTSDELSAPRLHDILRLHCDVLIVEQACVYPDVDGCDTEPTTTHHWIDSDDSLVAYPACVATRMAPIASAGW